MNDSRHNTRRRRQDGIARIWAGPLVRLPARGVLALIWLYRHSLSPVLPVLCGPGCGCRFHPTCAVYAADAVRTYGAVRGSWLAVQRLVKCHPWNRGGFDPIPPPNPTSPSSPLKLLQPPRPVCRRLHAQPKMDRLSHATRNVDPLRV